jgi:hypothetical protein
VLRQAQRAHFAENGIATDWSLLFGAMSLIETIDFDQRKAA